MSFFVNKDLQVIISVQGNYQDPLPVVLFWHCWNPPSLVYDIDNQVSILELFEYFPFWLLILIQHIVLNITANQKDILHFDLHGKSYPNSYNVY